MDSVSSDTVVKHNGYILIRGKALKELKLQFVPVINVVSKRTICKIIHQFSELYLNFIYFCQKIVLWKSNLKKNI